MDRACSTDERRGMHAAVWWNTHKGDHKEDLDVDGRIILK
jgi:hypothetical protein